MIPGPRLGQGDHLAPILKTEIGTVEIETVGIETARIEIEIRLGGTQKGVIVRWIYTDLQGAKGVTQMIVLMSVAGTGAVAAA